VKKFLPLILLALFGVLLPNNAQADTAKIPGNYYRLSYSCAAPGVCSAIKGASDDAATDQQLLITVYDGSQNNFGTAKVFDVSEDLAALPKGGLTIPEGHAQGLFCMSVGNCEGIVKFVTGGTASKIPSDYDMAKPFNVSTFLVSEVSGVWQKPELIKTLDVLNHQIPQNYFWTGDIWCASHGNCNIIGNIGGAKQSQHKIGFSEYLGLNPYFLSQVDGVWGQPQFLMNNQLANRGAYFLLLQCKDLLQCVVYGEMIPSASVQTNLIRKYAIPGLPQSKKLPGNSAIPLGVNFIMTNGKWSKPNLTRGFAFVGAPYAKSTVFTEFPAESFNSIPTANVMPCIKKWNCQFAQARP